MPIGKSGNYHMNPHEMRRKGDDPGAPKSAAGPKRPADQETGGEDANGDGNHHHEIHEHDDGSAHSVHTHPDGQKEEMDHASYADAVQHENSQRGGDGDQDDGGAPPDMGGGDDMAGMYESHCK